MKRALAPLCALIAALAGCTDGRSPLTPKQFDMAPPDAAPPAPDGRAGPIGREGAASPEPVLGEQPARPEGEPTGPEDLQALSSAAEQGQPVQKPGAPPIKRLDAYRLRVGSVFVDRLNRFIEMPAKVNMQEGILEYFAVGTNGKLHESVLEVLAEPSHVHLGLLLIGLEPQTYHPPKEPHGWPEVATPGGRIELFIEWSDAKAGAPKRAGPEIWLYDRKAKGAAPAQQWFFVGSQFWNGRYTADLERSVVALIPDRNAVVAIGEDAGNPYRGADLGYEVYTDVIPPNGTPVKLIMKAHGAKPPKVEPGEKPVVPPAAPKPAAP